MATQALQAGNRQPPPIDQDQVEVVAGGVLLPSGCWSYDEIRWTDVPLTSANVGKIEGGVAEVTLANANVVVPVSARSYGDALCDRFACVRKAEITRIVLRESERKTETADPALLLVAPLALPWLLMWASDLNYASRGRDWTPPTYTHPEVPAHRQWLDTGYGTIEEASKQNKIGNPCAEYLPGSVMNDVQGLAWVYDNRKQMVDVECLASAAASHEAEGSRRP